MNVTFLGSVARYYTDKCADLANLVFICPNKRSTMFLKREFQQRASDAPVFMPRFVPFQAFVARRAPRQTPDHWEALFLLYDVYREILAKRGRKEGAGDFDKFIFWGNMILSDFDDIDRSMADAEAVYTNIYRFNQIRADYLTEEQKEVVRMMWGDTPMTRDVNSFWLHVRPDGTDPREDPRSLGSRFIALWEVLGDLYREFRRRLEARGMATAGMQSRLAAEAVRDTALEEIRAHRERYVFVGLSDIFPAEKVILDRYKEAGVAEFIWDTACADSFGGPTLTPRGLGAVSRLRACYPMPGDYDEATVPDDRNIEVIGVSSAVAQTKVAADIIASLAVEGHLMPDRAIRTAVILPDPSLLLPLLLAIPEEVNALNVTIALPYSQTTFATLLRSVVMMQSRKRMSRGRYAYYFADVIEILAHPHVALIAPHQARKVRDEIDRMTLYNVTTDTLAEKAPELDFIFRKISDPNDMDEVYDYLHGLLAGLDRALRARITVQAAEESVELQSLEALSERLDTMRRLMKDYDLVSGQATLFRIFERLMASGILTVTGTPLQGMQVMGALETRALDFDNIIYLSLNERTFPKRDALKTMIPAALRRGFGLSPIDREETVMNYYFYRSISRASRVWLLHDSRPASKGGGEISRYITQLQFAPPRGVTVLTRTIDLGRHQPQERKFLIEKTPGVMAELAELRRPGSKRFLSASALKDYMRCPLAFYLKYVKGFRAEDVPNDALDAAQTGTLFHRTMQLIFEPYRDVREINAAEVQIIVESGVIDDTLLRVYGEIRPDEAGLDKTRISPEGILVISQVRLQIESMLMAETRTYEPFIYHAGEEGDAHCATTWNVTPGLAVNFKMNIDRIDRCADGSLRFIDYKTGTDELSAASLEQLFNGDHKKQAIFQLMLYREVYSDLRGFTRPIDLRLHSLRDIMRTDCIQELRVGKKGLSDESLRRDFRTALDNLIYSIFDPDTPIIQVADAEKCKFCPFLTMCNRQLEPEKPY